MISRTSKRTFHVAIDDHHWLYAPLKDPHKTTQTLPNPHRSNLLFQVLHQLFPCFLTQLEFVTSPETRKEESQRFFVTQNRHLESLPATVVIHHNLLPYKFQPTKNHFRKPFIWLTVFPKDFRDSHLRHSRQRIAPLLRGHCLDSQIKLTRVV